jgi:hypothetical protein
VLNGRGLDVGGREVLFVSTRRQFLALAAAAVAVSATPGRILAHAHAESTPTVDETVAALGLQEIAITTTDTGFAAPADVKAGRSRVTLVAKTGQRVEAALVKLPAGLSADAAKEQVGGDLPIKDAIYAGGVSAIDGGSGWVVLELVEGDWTIAVTAMDLAAQDAPPQVSMLSLTVAANDAATVDVPAAVKTQVTEFAFIGLKDATIPAGPQIWSVENVGAQPHHIVLLGTPKLVTDEDVKAVTAAMMSATPTPPPDWFMQATEAGYVSVLSPKQTVWTEFDLKPGFYLALCFVVDAETQMPHVMEGMHQAFTVA